MAENGTDEGARTRLLRAVEGHSTGERARPLALIHHKLALCDELGHLVDMVDVTDSEPAALDPEITGRTEILVTSGLRPVVPLQLLPALKLIHCMGAGLENIDLAEVRRRGIAVTNGRGANADSVADHAVALLLALLRRIVDLDRLTRAGRWSAPGNLEELGDRRIGIVGMGDIGRRIARRVEAFGASVSYVASAPKPDLDHRFFGSVAEMAGHVDTLIVAAPETPATFHLINAAVLERLGTGGFVINVGRGTVVDTSALVHALKYGNIAGAGLDVFEGEPDVPEALRACERLILTPHVAGSTASSRRRMQRIMLETVAAFVAGQPVIDAARGS